MGKNKIGSLMKEMVAASNVEKLGRNLTNTSARKHLVQKLVDNGVPNTHIMQITGHTNVQSINSYSRMNETQCQNIGMLLVGARKPNVISPNAVLLLHVQSFPNFISFKPQ